MTVNGGWPAACVASGDLTKGYTLSLTRTLTIDLLNLSKVPLIYCDQQILSPLVVSDMLAVIFTTKIEKANRNTCSQLQS